MSKLKRPSLMQPRSSAESQMEHARDKLRGPSAVLLAVDFAALESAQQQADRARARARAEFKAWFKAWIRRNSGAV